MLRDPTETPAEAMLTVAGLTASAVHARSHREPVPTVPGLLRDELRANPSAATACGPSRVDPAGVHLRGCSSRAESVR